MARLLALMGIDADGMRNTVPSGLGLRYLYKRKAEVEEISKRHQSFSRNLY